MKKLNKYQKIRLVLLIIIIIEITIFVISAAKKYETNKLSAEQENLYAENEEDDIMIINLEQKEDEEDTSWDEENVEDSEVDMEDEENSEENNSAKYYLKVNYTANVVTAYTKDSDGKYTIPVKAMICSTGTATPTSGVYATSDKYRWHLLNGGVYGQYCTRITGHILFHSVPYKTNSPDTLKYSAYDKLGTSASAGCVRLTVEDALWIYNNCASGTYVEFYSSTDPGPLGKPTAQKISSVVECRDWDPTDPDSRNPWRTYTGSTSTSTSETQSDTTTESTETQEETESTSANISDSTTEAEDNNLSNENNTNANTNTNTNNTSANNMDTNNTNTNNTNTNSTNNTNEENTIENKDNTNTG